MLNAAKIALLVALLLAFAGIGIGSAFNPDWGMRHFARTLLGGGELKKDWSRTQMSVVGLIFAGLALYLLYVLIFR
jgi:glycerol uptake facilitator-like aquaporin